MNRLDEIVSETRFDTLINHLSPTPDVFHVTLQGGQGVLARGAVLARKDGKMTLHGGAEGASANCILADAVDTGADAGANITALAYRAGHFSRNAVLVAEGYALTDADEEALRGLGILLSDAQGA